MPATTPVQKKSTRKSRGKPSRKPAALMAELSHRGPHRVLRGDLRIVGMSGQVFTPATGRKMPAIAFGHGWLTRSARYRDLLYHLASWGLVVVAPDGESGALPSDTEYAAELRAALGIVSAVPLGVGAVTVDGDRVGFAGHGFGASAAVIAASTQPIHGQAALPAAGAAAVFPAPTTSALVPAAEQVRAPGLVLAGAAELHTVDANALTLAQAYGGDVALRTIPKATAGDLVERRTLKSLIGINGADAAVHRQVRAVCAGFLLHTVGGDPEYQAFSDPETQLGKLARIDLDDPPAIEVDPVSNLFGAKPPKRRGGKR